MERPVASFVLFTSTLYRHLHSIQQWFFSSPLITNSSSSKRTSQNAPYSSKTCSRVKPNPIIPPVRRPDTRLFRRRRERPAHTTSQRVVERSEKGTHSHCESTVFSSSTSCLLRSSNTANIIEENDFRLLTLSHKMKLASAPPISASGIRSLSRSTRRCFSRLSWQLTISISSPSCQCL